MRKVEDGKGGLMCSEKKAFLGPTQSTGETAEQGLRLKKGGRVRLCDIARASGQKVKSCIGGGRKRPVNGILRGKKNWAIRGTRQGSAGRDATMLEVKKNFTCDWKRIGSKR